MQIYGITGSPLGHSLSPVLHNWALARAGIAGAYAAWPLEAGRMPDFVNAVRALSIRGVSVTIPHKEAVMPYLDGLTERASALGAVNTLYWDQNRLCGENTDVAGFIAPLRGRAFTGALVLGAGGAARAALAGLRELGLPRIALCNRNRERARKLADAFGVQCVDWDERAAHAADLIVNATPLGMHGAHEDHSPLPPEAFMRRRGTACTAYDLIYRPLRTRFLADAEAAGWRTQSGLDMFIAQAQAQFRLWTGREFSAPDARALLLRELVP